MDLKALAEKPVFIILTYVFSFGLWGILFALDFISSNWRTIHETFYSGLIHLILSLITLPIALFYLIAQQAKGDYKEMMAACVAAVVALYHIFRSVSGLIQLRCYSRWCTKAYLCLHRLQCVDRVQRNPLRDHEDYKHLRMAKYAHTYEILPCIHDHCSIVSSTSTTAISENGAPNGNSRPSTSSDSFRTARSRLESSTRIEIEEEHPRQELTEKAAAKIINERMYVNNQVIDNELFSSELPVRLCRPRCGILQALKNLFFLRFEDWVGSKDLVRCSFRWTIAILSNFGRHWLQCNKPGTYPKTTLDLHLPYNKQPELFHHVLRAQQNTLQTDRLFYHAGALDEMDSLLAGEKSEVTASESRMEALRNLDTKQILLFLALVASDGDINDIPMEQPSLRRSSSMDAIPPSTPPTNWSQRIPSNSSLDSLFPAIPNAMSESTRSSSPISRQPYADVQRIPAPSEDTENEPAPVAATHTYDSSAVPAVSVLRPPSGSSQKSPRISGHIKFALPPRLPSPPSPNELTTVLVDSPTTQNTAQSNNSVQALPSQEVQESSSTPEAQASPVDSQNPPQRSFCSIT